MTDLTGCPRQSNVAGRCAYYDPELCTWVPTKSSAGDSCAHGRRYARPFRTFVPRLGAGTSWFRNDHSDPNTAAHRKSRFAAGSSSEQLARLREIASARPNKWSPMRALQREHALKSSTSIWLSGKKVCRACRLGAAARPVSCFVSICTASDQWHLSGRSHSKSSPATRWRTQWY